MYVCVRARMPRPYFCKRAGASYHHLLACWCVAVGIIMLNGIRIHSMVVRRGGWSQIPVLDIYVSPTSTYGSIFERSISIVYIHITRVPGRW